MSLSMCVPGLVQQEKKNIFPTCINAEVRRKYPSHVHLFCSVSARIFLFQKMDYFVIGSCPNSMEQGGGKERKKVMNPNPSSYKMQVFT